MAAQHQLDLIHGVLDRRSPRNRRIEVCLPIQRRTHRQRILADLQLYLADNCQAWVLQPDGKYLHAQPQDEPPVSAQSELLASLAN